MEATMEATATADELAVLLAIQISAVNGKGEFEGYAALWDQPDRYGTIVAKGAFDDLLAEFAASKLYPPLMWEHDAAAVIGSDRLEADDKGLRVYGQLDMKDANGQRAFDRITTSQFYLSFWAGADIPSKMTDGEGRTVYTKFLYIRDISITSNPGQQLAAIDVVRNRHKADVDAAKQAGYTAGLAEGRAAAAKDYDLAAVLAFLKSWAKSK
jgi:HK97 family phage prohead protease